MLELLQALWGLVTEEWFMFLVFVKLVKHATRTR